MTDQFLTSHQLARKLLQSDDVPIVLRVDDQGERQATLLTAASVSLNEHSQSGTEWGDLPKVVRFNVVMLDNA